MENGFAAQTLSHPALVLAGLPDALRMQLGPFNPQIQDVKGLTSLHSLNASAFRLRYGNYPGFPAHLIHHLPFPSAVDPRAVHFSAGSFRPFNLSASPKLFPSAFAPPHKSSDSIETGQDLSPGAYVSKIYDEDDSGFRGINEREMELPCGDLSGKSEGLRAATPGSSPKTVKDEKSESGIGKTYDGPTSIESDTSSTSNQEDDKIRRRQKHQFDPTCCPICGVIVLLGDAENHFFKEVDRLTSMTASLTRERKFIFGSFASFNNVYGEENGHASESGLPRSRWETFQRIKSNRLSRLRVKNRRRKSGEVPLCPVCNEKLEGSVEDINLHVEHCLKKHSETEDDEDENIDVEGDTEVYGEYEWAAGLLTTAAAAAAAVASNRKLEKEEVQTVDGDESSALTPTQMSDLDVNMEEENRQTPGMRDSHLSKSTLKGGGVNGK